jgi:hypothetical protein
MPDVTPGSEIGVAVIGSGRWGVDLIRNHHGLGVLPAVVGPIRGRACPRESEALALEDEQGA